MGEIYPGIELRLRAWSENVEKLFFVRPGANYHQIRVSVAGGNSLRVVDSGELEVSQILDQYALPHLLPGRKERKGVNL